MPWIESHTELAQHPKIMRLARTLSVSVPTAVGHLHLLWWWAVTYARDGELAGFDAAEVCSAAQWEGEPEAFLTALKISRFVDDDGHLHDWEVYAGRLIEKRQADADRLRRWRGLRKAGGDSLAEGGISPEDAGGIALADGGPSPDRKGGAAPNGAPYKGNADETRTSQVTVPNHTGPNRTIPDIADVPENERLPAHAGRASPKPDSVPEIFGYYRERIQPSARNCPDAKIRQRLKHWSVAEIKTAIDHFAGDPWYMENNAHQGAAWFFHSDERIERLVNLKPRTGERNGTTHEQRPGGVRAAAGAHGGGGRKSFERPVDDAMRAKLASLGHRSEPT